MLALLATVGSFSLAAAGWSDDFIKKTDSINIGEELSLGDGLSQIDSNKSTDADQSWTANEKAYACRDECDLDFNACKLSDKDAQDLCSPRHEACLLSCPQILPTKEDAGPSAKSLPLPEELCQSGELTPVRQDVTYLILTRSLFVDALQPFIEAKQRAGETVDLVLVEQIACSEPGADIPEKIRGYLARVSTAATLKKRPIPALIVGAPRRVEDIRSVGEIGSMGNYLKEEWDIPMRYFYPLGGQLEPIPTDQYYASVFVAWDTALEYHYRSRYSDELNRTVTRDHWAAGFDFSNQFDVGRIPVRSPEELSHWVHKTLEWRPSRVFTESKFVTAGCSTRNIDGDDTWEDAATHRVIPHVCQSDNGGDISTYANQEAPDLISSYSHGMYDQITPLPSVNGYSLTVNSPGFRKPPILFVHGCEVGGIDFPRLSLAESFMRRRDGAVAFIGSTRSHWDSAFPFQDAVFHGGHIYLGEAFYQAKKRLVAERHLPLKLIDNLFMYNLYGDPRLQVIDPAVRITAQTPVAFVRGEQASEEALVPVNIASSLFDRDLEGGLYQYNDTSPTVRVSRNSSVQTTLRARGIPIGYPTTRSVAETMGYFRDRAARFSSEASIGTAPYATERGCDTRTMTCISPTVRVSAPLQLACGRVDLTFDLVNNSWQRTGRYAEVKLLRQQASFYSGPVSFVLRIRPRGYYRSYDEYFNQPPVEAARIPVAVPQTGRVYSFNFSIAPSGEDYVGDRPGQYYVGSSYSVEATDARGRVIGFCSYSFEPNI